FKGTDTASNSSITGAASCTRAAGEGVGTYAITCTPNTLAAPNYSFATGPTALLTIAKAPLSVNADPKSKTFGNADPAFTSTLTGFKGTDNAGNSRSEARREGK